MKWRNVKLILGREVRDQLRDRRTLFTVLVLPLLLYPLMGIALLQVSQFARQQEMRIWLVGSRNLPSSPPLVVDHAINRRLLDRTDQLPIDVVIDADDSRILALVDEFKMAKDDVHGSRFVDQIIQKELMARQADAAIVVSAGVQLDPGIDSTGDPPSLPRLMVFSDSAREKSSLAAQQVNHVLARYQQSIAMQMLKAQNIDPAHLEAFVVSNADIADRQWKQAATWSKILPFILMIWSLTGAFYPAVDLCAGEKERGTFETLLSSPALRNEIAIAKLLTVMTFSVATSLLNLLSMGFTGIFVVSRLGASLAVEPAGMAALGVPPISSLVWLLVAMLPISALFSAVALAAASFAKSSKEGQYYLVPLMMISMPLMMIPMLPAAKLDLGSSLIPVSGLMLMLRGLIEGRHADVLKFAGPVVAVTLACCWLAIRWVVIQFNRESVIFRPSERFSVNHWLKQVIRDRDEMPLVGQAVLCGVIILVIKFFVGLSATAPETWLQFSRQTVIVLVASVAMPAVLMAMFLTRNPIKALKLKGCRIPVACAAALAAILLHPCVTWLTALVMTIYPPSGDLTMMERIMSAILADAPGFWAILLVLAVAPALMEELAFRGFILSGLQSLGSNFKAVLIASLLFGAAHSILQQSIITFFLGCLLGLLAVKTGSLIPCMVYHMVHNGMSVFISLSSGASGPQNGFLKSVLEMTSSGAFQYQLAPGVAMTILGAMLLYWISRNAGTVPQAAESRRCANAWPFGWSTTRNPAQAP